MGLSESKGRCTFVSVLRHMLRERGLKVSKAITGRFYDCIVNVAPWFPEDGGLTLEDWKRLGRYMRKYLSSHKEETPPPQTFPLWAKIRDILLEKSDLEFLIEEAPSEQDEDEAPINKCGPPKYRATGDDPDDWDLEDARKYESEEYYPEEYNNPPPQVMISAPIKKHGKPVPKPRRYLPPIGFQGAIAQAKAEGDMSFTFPIVLYDDEEPTCEALPLKTLKELQLAVKSLRPSAPYTIQILEMISTQWLTVYDWFQTAKATLSPGNFVLWRTEYEETAKEAVCSSFAKKRAKPTMSMLLGEAEYTQPAAQMRNLFSSPVPAADRDRCSTAKKQTKKRELPRPRQ
ncbi:endogenous retrovirus group K member 8 Gag polyprotein-like [Fukomys damarensis]|uniref:endogenous retrovirus group K member 8 Gag polyprotein-like n=1 Tax=Fukomys damarensis TaxID=885580 RepID=UPI00145536B5|nr:endogenous retrovirus group K member 8 Gag polyprotein-like [Fukomys damarensis]